MSYQLPPLPWLRSFEASARLGSFTKAAEELLLTPAAVSYQVRALEEHLGFTLFERKPRYLVLTRLGQAYLPSISKAFSDISRSTKGVFGKKDTTLLRIRCLNTFAITWMVPRLQRFKDLHPSITLQLHSASWAEKLIEDQIDVDIRYGDGNWAH
ncbi:MAG: LysR family transcriptional regulator, partial [Alphaproteobacteria bacterium]|nr:LysR family transcriptional regulator [Alphaproteobacteria bacterium]